MVFPGWHIVSGSKSSLEYSFLQRIKPGPIVFHTLHSKASMIELKTHYTESNLLHQLEKKGIGRPSTYAGLVDKLQ